MTQAIWPVRENMIKTVQNLRLFRIKIPHIAALQKTKDNLIASDNQLRLANDKAEDLSIKKLTRGAPSVAAKLASIKAAVPGAKTVAPGDTVNAGDSATPESDDDKSA